MTIGPAPITQIDSRSGRLGIPDLLDPALDLGPGVVRARARFRVELERPRVVLGERGALDGAVVERDVCALGAVAARREAVVLARDEAAARLRVEHWVVGAAMAERELVGLEPGREREELVAEADPQDRDAAEELLDDPDLIGERGGIARAVREEHSRGPGGENRGRVRVVWPDGHADAGRL